jgi:dTDP-4-amino-4,6-dideoxygalactose transaminase
VSGERTPPPIPLARPSFGAEEERGLLETLRSGWVTQGPRVAEFEQRFAQVVQARDAVAVSSGTTALFLALHALGVGPGDEVIVPSLSFIASANAIVHCGASPVFVDVEPQTYNLDPAAVAAALSPRTRAVLAVHQLGLPADLDRLTEVARSHGVALVEDAACAVGSRWRGRPIGSSGNPVCFSFHPRKLLVTGEGGMIATGDPRLAGRLRRLRHQGMSVSDAERHRAQRVILETYPEVGFNFRLSDLHAALGLAQLERLPAFVAERRALAARYAEALAGEARLGLPREPAGAEGNFQSYIVRLNGADAAERNALMDALLAQGVGTRRGLMASHLEPCHRDARRAGPLPHSEAAAAQTFLLPLYAGLAPADQERVIATLRALLAASPWRAGGARP